MSTNVLGNITLGLRANTASFTSDLNKAKNEAKKAAQEMKSEIQESNHSLALVGETFGVHIPRHIRTFVSELPGVSRAMSAAFDGLAVLLVIKVIAEAVEKVKEFREALQAAQEQPKKIAEAFSALHAPIQTSNDELAVTNDKLASSIAKLEHKPANNLKLALDEARVFADKLADSLQKDLNEMVKLLEGNQVSFWGKLLGQNDNSWVTEQAKNFRERINGITEEGNTSIHEAKDAKASDEAKAETRNKLTAAYANEIGKVRQQLDEALKKQKEFEKGPEIIEGLDGQTVAVSRGKDQSALISSLRGVLQQMYAEQDSVGLRYQNSELQGKSAALQAANDTSAEYMRQAEADLAKYKQTHELTVYEEEAFWASRIAKLKAGSNAYLQVSKMLGDLNQRQLKEEEQARASLNATLSRLDNESYREHRKDDPSVNSANNRGIVEWVRLAQQGQSIQQKNAETLAEANIHYQLSAGYITQLGAAQQLAGLHTQQYTRELESLREELERIQNASYLTAGEKKAQSQQVQNQIAQLDGARRVQELSEHLATSMQTASAGMREFFRQFNEEAENTGRVISQALSQAIGGANENLSRMLTGQKANWESLFRGLAQSLAKSGLEKVEHSLLSSLHLGSGKPDGSSEANALWVRTSATSGTGMVGTLTSGVSSAGGAVGNIIGGVSKFLSFMPFADGGDLDPNRASIVGENGIELFSPGTQGHVTSNRDLKKLLGGVGETHYHIDARGTNAAEVELRVRRAMEEVHQQSVHNAVAAQHELNQRRPSRQRF